MFNEDIGIDLGTASVLVFIRDKGIVLHEPSVVAMDQNTNKMVAVGEEARRMLGRTPGNIIATRPLKDGVIADYDVTEQMLTYFLRKVMGRRWLMKPRVVVCIPSGATDVEERAVRQATLAAGARNAYIVEEPLAAALGAGINIAEATGNMVVDIGGGTTDIAILSLGGIVCQTSLRVGGDKFDEAIIKYIRREHNLMVGERTAEDIKIKVGSAYPALKTDEECTEVRGRDMLSGLPKTIHFTSQESYAAMKDTIDAVITSVKEVLEKTPPELAADIVNNGIVMTGGGALLHGLSDLLAKETGLSVRVADKAISCVAIGTGKLLANMGVIGQVQDGSARKIF